MNIAFYTLGCKVNQYETESLSELFSKNNYTVSELNDADIIVINSCTVTAESDRKTGQTVRKFRRNYPNTVIVLIGCMPQAFPEKASKLADADIITGNTSHEKILNLVNNYLCDRKRIIEINQHTENELFNTPCIHNFSERTRAYIKIEDGCERYCTYCIIPYARGKVRSKLPQKIKDEALSLALNGFKEIVLVGINLSAYGTDIGLNLCDAVDAVSEINGIMRIRLGSLEPDHISDNMLERLKSNEKFCPQFHLSLQSGCDETLKHMNRHYDTAFYSDLINRIRMVFDNPSITTDIMVGFAGESDMDFEKSLLFAKKTGFAKVHVFSYSRRKGTVAYSMQHQVDEAVKEERSHKMITACRDAANEFLQSQVDKKVNVLFETEINGIAEGYSENYVRIKCPGIGNYLHCILPVKITGCDDGFCNGEIII